VDTQEQTTEENETPEVREVEETEEIQKSTLETSDEVRF